MDKVTEGKLIYKRLAEINREVTAIAKERRNTQQNFNFRGIDDVYNTLHPLFAKHGVVLNPRRKNERTEERPTRSGGMSIYRLFDLEVDFIAEDGSFHTFGPVPCEASDSADKASNKALSQGIKNLLFVTFTIPIEGGMDEGDANGHEISGPAEATPTAQQPAPPTAAPTNGKPLSPGPGNTKDDPKLVQLRADLAAAVDQYKPEEAHRAKLLEVYHKVKNIYRALELLKELVVKAYTANMQAIQRDTVFLQLGEAKSVKDLERLVASLDLAMRAAAATKEEAPAQKEIW